MHIAPKQPADLSIIDIQGLDYSIIEPHWHGMVPGMPLDHDPNELIETKHALQQAERVLRAQEERIRILESLVLTDELTGIHNRRGFSAAFERELALARRDTNGCGIMVMVDLDGFKSINDRFGHQAGDVYLRTVALALQEAVRGTDTVARIGGDEFAILLVRMDEEHATKRMAKLERFFANRAMIWNGQRIPLRASFGYAAYGAMSVAEAVTQIADLRLGAHKVEKRQSGSVV